MLENQQIWAVRAVQLNAVLVIPFDGAVQSFAVLQDEHHWRVRVHLLFVIETLGIGLLRRNFFRCAAAACWAVCCEDWCTCALRAACTCASRSLTSANVVRINFLFNFGSPYVDLIFCWSGKANELHVIRSYFEPIANLSAFAVTPQRFRLVHAKPRLVTTEALLFPVVCEAN